MSHSSRSHCCTMLERWPPRKQYRQPSGLARANSAQPASRCALLSPDTGRCPSAMALSGPCSLEQMPTRRRSSSSIKGRFTVLGNAPLLNSTGARTSIMGMSVRNRVCRPMKSDGMGRSMGRRRDCASYYRRERRLRGCGGGLHAPRRNGALFWPRGGLVDTCRFAGTDCLLLSLTQKYLAPTGINLRARTAYTACIDDFSETAVAPLVLFAFT